VIRVPAHQDGTQLSSGGAVVNNPGEESSGSSINENGDGRISTPDEDPELANFIQEERLGRLKYKCKQCKFNKTVDKGTMHSDVVQSISHWCKSQQELVTELKRQGLLEYPKEDGERGLKKLMELSQTESLIEHSSRDASNDKPKAQQKKRRGPQMCNRCGQPRKGHDCLYSSDKLAAKFCQSACSKDKGERKLSHQEDENRAVTHRNEATGDYTAEHHRKQVEPPWYVAESQQKADNQPKSSTEAFCTSAEQVYIAPIGEDDRKPTAQVHRAFDTDNQEQKKVQESAKHGIKHAPPSRNLHDNAAIKDTACQDAQAQFPIERKPSIKNVSQ